MKGPIPPSWSPRLLSVLRFIAAFLYMAHGTQKLFGFPVPAGFPIASMSLPWFAGWIETVGGGLLLLGLFTRPVAFLCSGEMAVAYFTQHVPHGFWPLLNHGELPVLFCFIFLYLAAAKPGPWSVDARGRGGPS